MALPAAVWTDSPTVLPKSSRKPANSIHQENRQRLAGYVGFSYTGAPHRPNRCRSIKIGSHVGAVAQALVWASPPGGPLIWSVYGYRYCALISASISSKRARTAT